MNILLWFPRYILQTVALTVVELLCHSKVLKVLVVHPNFKFVPCTFKEMLPLFKGVDNGEHFLIVDLVVLFYCI